jgi:putative membrane protein
MSDCHKMDRFNEGFSGSILALHSIGKAECIKVSHGRMTTHSEIMLPPLRRFREDFRMHFYDLIISMEQSEISPRPVVGAIVVVSGLAVSFLLWPLYVHHASADFAGRWMFLPALNALLNGLCAIALCVGLYFIKHRNRAAHRTSMLLAFAFSSVFLISYIVNHALHGETIFPGHGPVRTVYLSILASHVILSIVALPMVLTTFFFSLTGRFAMHRRIARLTFPIWLYVSITGVVVFVFLKTYAY